MKTLKTILLLIILIVAAIAVAGMYKFNFTNDDLYVETKDGSFINIDELDFDISDVEVEQFKMEELLETENSENSVFLEEGIYTVLGEDSNINWRADMGTVKSHTGTILVKEGSLDVSEMNITGKIVLDVNSLESDGGDALNGHLKSADFFEAETYPTAELSITSINDGILSGGLTVKDVTKEISVPIILMELEGIQYIRGTYEFDRSQWNIKYGSSSFFDDLGDKVINNIVPIEFDIVIERN